MQTISQILILCSRIAHIDKMPCGLSQSRWTSASRLIFSSALNSGIRIFLNVLEPSWVNGNWIIWMSFCLQKVIIFGRTRREFRSWAVPYGIRVIISSMNCDFGTQYRHVNVYECKFIELIIFIPYLTSFKIFEDLPPTTRLLLDKLWPVALYFLIVYWSPIFVTCIWSNKSNMFVECGVNSIEFGGFCASIGLDKFGNASWGSVTSSRKCTFTS